jgi:hypothetical protein
MKNMNDLDELSQEAQRAYHLFTINSHINGFSFFKRTFTFKILHRCLKELENNRCIFCIRKKGNSIDAVITKSNVQKYINYLTKQRNLMQINKINKYFELDKDSNNIAQNSLNEI